MALNTRSCLIGLRQARSCSLLPSLVREFPSPLSALSSCPSWLTSSRALDARSHTGVMSWRYLFFVPLTQVLNNLVLDRLCPFPHQLSAIPRRSGEGLRGFDVRTLPYPGFPTDLQPQTMAMLSTCDGLSIIEESVFENRLTHGIMLCSLILKRILLGWVLMFGLSATYCPAPLQWKNCKSSELRFTPREVLRLYTGKGEESKFYSILYRCT